MIRVRVRVRASCRALTISDIRAYEVYEVYSPEGLGLEMSMNCNLALPIKPA